jgi:hypothetical protein
VKPASTAFGNSWVTRQTYTRTHAHTHARTRARTHARTQKHTLTHKHTNTQTRTHAHTRTHTHTQTHAHTKHTKHTTQNTKHTLEGLGNPLLESRHGSMPWDPKPAGIAPDGCFHNEFHGGEGWVEGRDSRTGIGLGGWAGDGWLDCGGRRIRQWVGCSGGQRKAVVFHLVGFRALCSRPPRP